MTAKGKAKEGDMRSDHRQHHKYGDPCVPVNSMSLPWSPSPFSFRAFLSRCIPNHTYAFDGYERASRHHFVEYW
jgi:hypothetical protein